MALLAGMLFFLFSLFPIPRSVQIGLVVLALWTFSLGAGLSPSTLRALVGVTAFLFAYLLRRNPDTLTALGLAATIEVTFFPWAVFTPGFQLSYVIVAALAIFWRSWKLPPKPTWVDKLAARAWAVIWAGFIAVLAAAPIQASLDGQLSLVSIPATLLVAPAVPLVICSSLLAWIVSGVFPALAHGLLAAVAIPCANWALRVADLVGSSPWASVPWPHISGYWCVPYYAALILVWRAPASRR